MNDFTVTVFVFCINLWEKKLVKIKASERFIDFY